jgi:hypothetical protein
MKSCFFDFLTKVCIFHLSEKHTGLRYGFRKRRRGNPGDQIAFALLDKTIIVWDVVSGEQRAVLNRNGRTRIVTRVSLSCKGDQIVSGAGFRGISLVVVK